MKVGGKTTFPLLALFLGEYFIIPKWEWEDGWKFLEAIKIPSETRVALSLLSNISAWCYVLAAHTPNWYDTYCRSNKPRTTAV